MHLNRRSNSQAEIEERIRQILHKLAESPNVRHRTLIFENEQRVEAISNHQPAE
jgi:hypothetical protein